MRVEQVVVEQELRADIGAGKLELISVKTKNMEVQCGVGEFLMRSHDRCAALAALREASR